MSAEPSQSEAPPERDVFRVLFLCTGNSCRSPIAAGLFENMVEGLPVEVMSAGTMERPPSPATPEAIQVAAELGADLSSHRSRSLSSISPDDIDLLIGFERDHVAKAVVEEGFPAERCFMLPELELLLRDADSEENPSPLARGRTLVKRANEQRGRSTTTFSTEWEITDPIGRPLAFYTATADRIQSLCRRVAAAMFEPSATS